MHLAKFRRRSKWNRMSPHQAETIVAVKKMIGEQVAVEGSSIPYRDW
jgi:hypothetical protein